MGYIGKTPTPAPLTSSDIAADIINSTHIGDTAISGFDALATAPADTDEFLISDAGVLKRLDASLVGGGGKLLQSSLVTTSTNQALSSTTSETTYTLYGKCDSSGKARINDNNEGRSTITLMEIGA